MIAVLTGNTKYGSNQAALVLHLPRGSHTVEVWYRTSQSVFFAEGGYDWQTRALSITRLPGLSSFLTVDNVVPSNSERDLVRDEWTDWENLWQVIQLTDNANVLVSYTLTLQTNGNTFESKVQYRNSAYSSWSDAAGSLQAVGRTKYASTSASLLLLELQKDAEYEIKVRKHFYTTYITNVFFCIAGCVPSRWPACTFWKA